MPPLLPIKHYYPYYSLILHHFTPLILPHIHSSFCEVIFGIKTQKFSLLCPLTPISTLLNRVTPLNFPTNLTSLLGLIFVTKLSKMSPKAPINLDFPYYPSSFISFCPLIYPLISHLSPPLKLPFKHTSFRR